MPSDLQARAINDEIPLQHRPPYLRDALDRGLSSAGTLDEDCDPVCTDEYALYSRALREQALARRRRCRS